MNILCFLNIHRYRWYFIGTSWYGTNVLACVRCEKMHPRVRPHATHGSVRIRLPKHGDSEGWTS